MRKIYIIIFLLFSVKVVAQKQASVQLSLSYDSLGHKIQLRWAADQAPLWQLANRYGYTVEKYYYERNGELLDLPLNKEILISDCKPRPLGEWEDIVQVNDYAAIAAQSIYGDGINLNDAQNGFFSIVNKSKELQSRFSFSLFAADQSVEVADYLGLYFEDYKVKENERYLYRVYANVPDSILSTDTASVYFGPKDYDPLPKPKVEAITQKDGKVIIRWLNAPYSHIFSTYIIERAYEEDNFKKINSLPIINFKKGPSKDNLFNTFIDTAQYQGKVSYRIFGRNSFGQISPSSDTLSIERLPKFRAPIPKIDTIYYTKEGANVIKWSASGETQYIKASFLEKSDESEGNYELVQIDSLNTNFTFEDFRPNAKKYYRVGVSTGNRINYSYPDIFQLIDSIPPATPEFAEYITKDSSLTISWHSNEEEDIAGYRIYKAQTKYSEPSMLYDAKNLDTVLTVIENLELINNERYYYITAFDKNGNTSDLSEAFEVELPDIIPPSAPIINKIYQVADTVKIDFIKSASVDVYKYLLYRSIDNSLYELVKALDSDKSKIIDRVKSEGSYKYRLIALDDSGNEGVSKATSINVIFKNSSNFEYQILENEDSFSIIWSNNANRKEQKVKVYYKSDLQLNLIREAKMDAGEIKITKGNKKKENFKVIII
ncbi:hypothetical protein QYS48_31285 [Marivirga arenosa]|uniref:Fibronectin type-III domain-containing protein n=1 Tax=Marivirga arenosa TaxID=3059076 RepID=A0AA51N4S0_9BACT|nr:hypothetical protein [Marivirga sp. ABR2-2]WMN06013.1 hypothetical protein QYS48_31285 [Marivirga sp. ABR2-2]